jgi:hypothetical protein
VLGAGDGYRILGYKHIRIRNIFDEDCQYVCVSSTVGMPRALTPQPPKRQAE